MLKTSITDETFLDKPIVGSAFESGSVLYTVQYIVINYSDRNGIGGTLLPTRT